MAYSFVETSKTFVQVGTPSSGEESFSEFEIAAKIFDRTRPVVVKGPQGVPICRVWHSHPIFHIQVPGQHKEWIIDKKLRDPFVAIDRIALLLSQAVHLEDCSNA